VTEFGLLAYLDNKNHLNYC